MEIQEQGQRQQLFDIETASADGSGSKQHLRQLGMSKLDAVLSKAQAGHDPWEFVQQPKRQQQSEGGVHDADVAAMGAWLERNRPLLLAGGMAVAQGGSWGLLKVSLTHSTQHGTAAALQWNTCVHHMGLQDEGVWEALATRPQGHCVCTGAAAELNA